MLVRLVALPAFVIKIKSTTPIVKIHYGTVVNYFLFPKSRTVCSRKKLRAFEYSIIVNSESPN
jgi:hypothetical protein